VIAQVGAGGPTPSQLELMPALAGKDAPQGVPTSYVCEHGTCLPPVQDAAELRTLLLAGWHC
jgi:uncharacterized protein YyaL (SSP411 family)